MLHVEDGVADLLRKNPVEGVALAGLVDETARTAPERVWAPLVDAGIKQCLETRRPSPRAIVIYPHREYDAMALFPRMRMVAKIADVPIIDGRTGKLVRRDPNDRMRDVYARVHPALRKAIDASLPSKEKAS